MTVTPTHLKKIRLGTRGSPLALVQANIVKSKIKALYPDIKTEIVVIKTTGDWTPEQQEQSLCSIQSKGQWAGKGLFAKEIQQAIIDDKIDAAVHSMKDMETTLPNGLTIQHMLPREDPRDILILSNQFKGQINSLAGLTSDMRIGTCSVRRAAFLRHKKFDIKIVPLRGNVQTRIEKMNNGQADAIFLAHAGLNRLGEADKIDIILNPSDMLPAAGQGAIGLETTEFNTEILSIFSQISCKKTILCVSAERAILKELDGSCNTPIGAYATINDGGMMHLRVAIAEKEGYQYWQDERSNTATTIEEAEELGRELGSIIKDKIPEDILN